MKFLLSSKLACDIGFYKHEPVVPFDLLQNLSPAHLLRVAVSALPFLYFVDKLRLLNTEKINFRAKRTQLMHTSLASDGRLVDMPVQYGPISL